MAKLEGTIKVEVVNMIKGMTTCKVCGRDFPLLIEERYTAHDPHKVGAIVNLLNTDPDTLYDAFDCPHCGCQNIIQTRKDSYFGWECDETEEEETPEPKSGEGCKSCCSCKYQDMADSEEPCANCAHNYVDKWEAMSNE